MLRRRRRRRGSCEVWRPSKLLVNVVDFVTAESANGGWREIGDIVNAGVSFGLVCHTGTVTAPRIRDHLDELLPVMSDDTLVVLCGLDKSRPRKAFFQLLDDGWDGLELHDMGLLKKLGRSKERGDAII